MSERSTPSNKASIHIRGLRVHNLKNIDLYVPRGKLVVISGVSGSGKSSLAFDTLFAEGQRRYIETFSAYTRQFLERIDRPDADSIENIPPAIAIRQRTATRNNRSTVGSVTEINDYLRLLYAKIGRVFCQGCGNEIQAVTSHSVTRYLDQLAAGTEFLITFPVELGKKSTLKELARSITADGFVRVIADDCVIKLDQTPLRRIPREKPLRVIVDRLTAGKAASDRLTDSVETAFAKGGGHCDIVLAHASSAPGRSSSSQLVRFTNRRHCANCDKSFPDPEPRLFNFNNPLGACPECKGFGDTIEIDMDRVVPDMSRSIRQGAIAPWNTPAYAHELDELLSLADDYGIAVDVPFEQLSKQQLTLIHQGVRERKFGGLRGFFNWLERKKYKMPIRVFLSRWRSYRTCAACRGRRLCETALATRVGGKNIAEFLSLENREAAKFIDEIELTAYERSVANILLDQIAGRLSYLISVGVGYLTLDRPLRTLSGGEAQRVALTKALGAGLVNTLYVLDEPSIGLHERDTHRLIQIVQALRDSRNSVVVVEHDDSLLRSADHLIDLGPAAGDAGGRIVFQGPLSELTEATNSKTADYLLGRKRIRTPGTRRAASNGWIKLRNARGNNLKGLDVDFPLGVLCVVTGVSGSGKSTLIDHTLYAGGCRQLNKPGPPPAAYDELLGLGQIGDIMLVDQSPIGRSSRSNPVTYVKAFDEIRRAFAESSEARIRNFGPGHFSFNVDGGRCNACEGQGTQIIDMQFLADISITCPECNGLRFRKEVLDVKYRGKNIAEVLAMSVKEAIGFFRGRNKIVTSLTPLASVGLDYLKLGQPCDTFSGGEAQRLKLAGQLAATTQQRTLIILDEPTTGLHAADILNLLDCFNALLSVGHSLVVVEHNMTLIQCADWIIDLGPDAAHEGGRLVACGTPEQIAAVAESHTGFYLNRILGSEPHASGLSTSTK